MREVFAIATSRREMLVDITEQVAAVVSGSGVADGLVSVYVQGATAAVMIQENWDESVQTDVVDLLRKLTLAGIVSLISPGTIFQSFCSVLLSMLFMGLHIKLCASNQPP